MNAPASSSATSSAAVLGGAWKRMQELDHRLLDGGLAVALSVAAAMQYLSEEPGNVGRLLPVVGTCLPLILRRRVPIACHVVQVACAIATQRQPVSVSLLAIFIGVYSVAVYSRYRMAFLVWILVAAASLGVAFPTSAPSVPAWALQLVGGVGLWSAGSAVRNRTLRAEALEERAVRLERERELTLHVALTDERQRIARELHDVVAHSVSVMVVQAGAARSVLNRRPDQAAEALLAVEATGREALGELRRLLGLLTEAEPETTALAPQPGLDQLDRLVERVGRAGLPIDLQITGPRRTLPPGLDLTAYRILQEALTNALKYAGGANTHVRIDYADRELRLEVLDGGAPRSAESSGSGRGLLGMQERVAVYGGLLETGQRPEGGFAVRASLPLQPT